MVALRTLTIFSLLPALSACSVGEDPTGPDVSGLTVQYNRTERSKIKAEFRVSATFGDVGIGPPLFTNAEACDFGYERTAGKIKIKERHAGTKVQIKVRRAVPDQFHTVWLRLDGVSPLTGLPASPLVPRSGLDELAPFTPPNPGQTYALSGFWTDHRGKGKVTIELDFALSAGVYPFPSGDVPIATEPFTIAIASHCVDHVGHGLVPGPHENTLQWP